MLTSLFSPFSTNASFPTLWLKTCTVYTEKKSSVPISYLSIPLFVDFSCWEGIYETAE